MGLTAGSAIALGSLGLVVCLVPGASLAQVVGKPAETTTPASASPPPAPDAFDALEVRVHALEREVAETQTLVAEVSGRPVKAPADLPERFKRAAVLQAVRLAFREVNPKAEVLDVDCAEYPCIAYGTGLSTAQLAGLRACPALASYQQDTVSTFAWGDVVAVIPTPKNDPTLGGDAEQRILLRFHHVATASKEH
jgi:hypothetical protein